jgi:hypothetical protein
MIVLKRTITKNCNWICSFWILLDFLGFFSLIQISWPIIPWKICVKIAFFSWSSFLLWNHFCDWNILEPEKNPFAEGLPIHCWQKNRKIYKYCKNYMKQIGSNSEKDKWRWTRRWKPYKMALRKKQLTLNSCQNRCSTKWFWDFYIFYKINKYIDLIIF